MKKISVPKSTFFVPRASGSFLCSMGAFLTFVFVAFSGSSAVAQCSDVEFNQTQEYYGHMYVQMSSDSGCTIYYTVRSGQLPVNPTHSSAIYNPTNNPNYEGLGVPIGAHLWYKALAYQYPYADSSITYYEADNTQQ